MLKLKVLKASVLMPVILWQPTIRGIAVAPRSSFDRMNPFLNQYRIKPVIDQVVQTQPLNRWVSFCPMLQPASNDLFLPLRAAR